MKKKIICLLLSFAMIFSTLTPVSLVKALSMPGAPENLRWTDSGAAWDAPATGDPADSYVLSLYKQLSETAELIVQAYGITETAVDLTVAIETGGSGTYFYTVYGVNEGGEGPAAISGYAGFEVFTEETSTAEENTSEETTATEETTTEESTSVEEITAGEETTVAEGTTEETAAIEETNSAEETASAEETTVPEESTEKAVTIEETTPAEETTAVEETTAAEETSEDATAIAETDPAEETASAEETTAPEEITEEAVTTVETDPVETTPVETLPVETDPAEETSIAIEETDSAEDPTDSAEDPTDPAETEPEGPRMSEEEQTWSAHLEEGTITVWAEAGAFPEGATLSVTTVPLVEQYKVETAVEEVREEGRNVAVSYTFDIKILDGEGNELQPAEGKLVKVSFEMAHVASANLTPQVYHTDGEYNTTELPVETEGETATVETGGFSFFTVEFTYGDKQYVLEGKGRVKLSELLDFLEIQGEVKSVDISNRGLFDVIMGGEDSLRYLTAYKNGEWTYYPANDPRGTVRWVISYEPFQTEEWMDVLMEDGITYHIIVTDAIINSGVDDVNVDGLYQGVNPTFSANIPVADIWIDETIVNQTVDSRNQAEFISGEIMDPTSEKYHPGFVIDTSGASSASGNGLGGYAGNHFIVFDTSLETLSGTRTVYLKEDNSNPPTPYAQSYNEFQGVLGTYKWENAAVGPNGELLDVYVEYSNPIITIGDDPSYDHPFQLAKPATISLFGGNMMALGWLYKDGGVPSDNRVGVEMTIRPYVRDKNGNHVSGNFYYPMTDIDVLRTSAGYGFLYGSNSAYSNYDETLNKWSETVIIRQGLVQNSKGEMVFIPGDIDNGDNIYVSKIYKESNGAFIFTAGDNGSDDNTFYGGFMTLVTNNSFSVTWRGSTANGNNSGINTNILCGMPGDYYNYRLRHSTQTLPSDNNPYPAGNDGGNIATTREGNRNGKLDDGEIIDPAVIAAARGQTVTYTFYPEPGYGLREVWLWDDKNYTYATVPADKQGVYEWADGADRYRYLSTFGEVSQAARENNTWVYDGFVYWWDGTEWQHSLSFSDASLRARRTHEWVWTDISTGVTYTYKYENKEWRRYEDPASTDYEVVSDPPESATYSGSGIVPPAEATSPGGAGEWHLFRYYNQVDDDTKKARTWINGAYTYEYIPGSNDWMRTIHFEDVRITDRELYTWYETIDDGVNTTLYEYVIEDGNWHKYDVTDRSNPIDKGEQDPPGNAVTYEWGFAPPDGAVSDYGQHSVPGTATNVFPTTDSMRQGAGYRIYEGDGYNGTYLAHDDDGDGSIDRYTFTFEDIDNNHAIHVVWGQTVLEIRKQVTGNDVVEDTFTFRIMAWGDADNDGNTDYIDFREAELYDSTLRGKFALVSSSEAGGQNNVYQFTLKGGESVALPPQLIPAGFQYKVWEVERNGEYGTQGNWKLMGEQIRTGSFSNDNASAQVNFLNKRDKVIDPQQKLTVVKVWDNDSLSLRPENITITIKKPTAIGIGASGFAGQVKRLVPAAQLTGIIYGDKARMEAVPEGELIRMSATSGQGEGTLYLWKEGTDVYFYSESAIYLTGSGKSAFSGCNVLTDISGLAFVHTDFLTSMQAMFYQCFQLQDLSPLENWDVTNVTNMQQAFAAINGTGTAGYADATRMHYTELSHLRGWNVANVTNMAYMFAASDVSDLTPLADWGTKTSRVTNMQGMFLRTLAAANTTPINLESWDVGAVTNFTNMFYRAAGKNSNLTNAERRNLPDWTKAPSSRGNTNNPKWNSSGTFSLTSNDSPHYNTAPQVWNDEAHFWEEENKVVTQYTTSHTVDPSNENVWIYEFEVPADDASWRVYETLPGDSSDYYSVSATEPIEDSNVLFQKWIYKNTVYDTWDAGEAAAYGDIDSTSIPGKWIFNKVEYGTEEEAREAAKAAVLPYIVADRWFYNGNRYDSYAEAEAAAYADIDSTTTPDKWIFNGVTYETEAEAKTAARSAITQVFIKGLGVENNPVLDAKAGTTTTIKNTRKEVELKIHKDATAAGLEDAKKTAKEIYMTELAALETDPDRKTRLQAFDENVLTAAEAEELAARQTAACTFTFTLKLWDGDESKPYNIRADRLPLTVTHVFDGLYTFTLIPDPDAMEEFLLPAGISYRVEETASEGWHLASFRNTEGFLNREVTEVFFLNTRTDVLSVVKQWEDDEFASAVMSTRPTGRDSLGIVVTTLDTGTRWKVTGSGHDVYSGDLIHFTDVRNAWEGASVTPDVRNADGNTLYNATDPRYVYFSTGLVLSTVLPAGNYVIDKKSDTHYVVIPVENVPFQKTYTSSDASNFLEDDGAGTWLYQFAIPSTEKVLDVKETRLPGYYQKVETSTDASGRIVYNIVNTLDKRDLKIEKHTSDNEEGVFDFVVKFFVEHRTPYELDPHQIPTNVQGSGGTYTFKLRNGQSITFKDLPVGVSYEVVESRHEGWNLKEARNDTGMMTDGAVEKWTYTHKNGSAIDKYEYVSMSATETVLFTRISGNETDGFGIGGITFTTLEAAQLAAMDAVEVSDDGLEFYLMVGGVTTTYASLSDAQDAAKLLVSSEQDAASTKDYFFVNPALLYPTRLSAERAASKAIEKAPYQPRTARFTNEREKGDLEIIKETVLNEEGSFKFRVKIWDIEDVYTFTNAGILPTGSGTVASIQEIMAVIADLNLEADQGPHHGIRDYVDANNITTDKTAVLVDSHAQGICFTIGAGSDQKTYYFGTYDYINGIEDIPASFKEQAEALDGDVQFYILEDGVLIGACSAGFADDVEHPMVLNAGGDTTITPVSGEGNEGVYEFTLVVDADNATNKNNIRLFEDIPYGYRYEVWELTPEGWELINLSNDDNGNKMADGTMLTTGKYTYTFTNDRVKIPLTIGKLVDGDQGSKDKYFKFTITIGNAGDRTLHLDMTNATHSLPNGASGTGKPNSATAYTWNVILNGSGQEGGNARDDDGSKTYSEAANEGWAKNFEWSDVTYTYRWNEAVDGWDKYENDELRDSGVTVPDNATRTPGQNQRIRTSSGAATIVVYLRHGETVTLRDLPFGASYTVTEAEEDYKPFVAITGPMDGSTDPATNLADTRTGETRDANYAMTTGTADITVGNRNNIADTCLTKATNITFTNTRDGMVPTEIRTRPLVVGLILMAIAIPVVFGARGRRLKEAVEEVPRVTRYGRSRKRRRR